MLNATAVLTVAHVLGLDIDAAAKALSSFEGVRRRFTHVGDIDGITVVDDYGHHPTEIKATLAAASSLGYKHVDVVFQPHRYSRLQALCDDFADAFANADKLLLIDVFSAGEMPIPVSPLRCSPIPCAPSILARRSCTAPAVLSSIRSSSRWWARATCCSPWVPATLRPSVPSLSSI